MSDFIHLAQGFATAAHNGQTRKDGTTPYITHPALVAALTQEFGGDDHAIAAAWLHDVVEDCDGFEFETLADHFPDEVVALVREMSDDKSLAKERRKELQVENAPHKSPMATRIKIADKCANLMSLAEAPPMDWPRKRRLGYIDWVEAVVAGLPNPPEAAMKRFAELVFVARAAVG